MASLSPATAGGGRASYLHLGGLLPGERAQATALGAILFGNSLATQVSGIAAVAGFLSNVGVPQMIPVWIVDYVLMLGLSGVQSLLVDRWDRRRLLGWVTLVFAAIFLLIRLSFALGAPPWVGYSLLYLISDQQWQFFPLLLWALAGDMYETAAARRVYPHVSSLGFLGRLSGIAVAAFSPSVLVALRARPEDLVLLNVAVYVALYGVSRWRLGSVAAHRRSLTETDVLKTLSDGLDFVRKVPAFKFLTISALAVACCDLIVEYQFYVATDAAFPTTATYQTFFSVYRLLFTLAALGIESFLVQRFIQRFGFKNAFLVLPVSALGGALGVLAVPSLATAVAGNVLQKLPRTTVDETARKNLQTLVPEEMRGRVSILMDSYMFSIGSILGAIVLGIVVAAQLEFRLPSLFTLYLGLAALAGLVAVWSSAEMRRTYDASLLSGWLRRRKRVSSVVDRLG